MKADDFQRGRRMVPDPDKPATTPEPAPPRRNVAFKLPAWEYDQWKALAAREHRSLVTVIRLAMADRLIASGITTER